MIPNGTRVQVNMDNRDDLAVITVLNRIGGEIVRQLNDVKTRIGYLVAYDAEHIPEIERARDLDTENRKGTMFFSILGKMRPKEFPNDQRYYLLAFESETKPA